MKGHFAAVEDSSELTARETEILALLVQGHSNKTVADKLSVRTKTVDNHRAHIMRKLGVHSFRDLMVHAVRNKLVDL